MDLPGQPDAGAGQVFHKDFMILKVDTSTLSLIKPGAKISLSNNGAHQIRILDAERFQPIATLHDSQIEFHTNDAQTTITLKGYLDFNAGAFYFVRLNLK